MSRLELPATRDSLTHKRVICGHKCYFTVSFMESGNEENRCKPAEVFCQIAKEGTLVAGLVNAITWLISTSLQNSIPWEEVSRGLRHHTFERREDEHHTSLIDGIAKSVDHLIEERKKRIGVGEEPPRVTTAVSTSGSDVIVPEMIGGIRSKGEHPSFRRLVDSALMNNRTMAITDIAAIGPRLVCGLSRGAIVSVHAYVSVDGYAVRVAYEDGSYSNIQPSGNYSWDHDCVTKLTNSELVEAIKGFNISGKYIEKDRRETLVQQYLIHKGLLGNDGKPHPLVGGNQQ